MIGLNLSQAFAGIDFLPAQVAVMRDGVRLYSDVYRPQGDGPWPVLLMRQPYGRDIASTVVYAHPTWWARQGFLVVIQDVRGRGDSEGEFYPFRHELADGEDTVHWAAALPGSNGRVGMYGFSYQAATQLLAALARPRPLRALAPHMTAFDLHSGWFYRDGILQLAPTLSWANQMLREDARRRGAASQTALDVSWQAPGLMSLQLPIREVAPLTHADLPRYAADWLGHTDPEGYWREFNWLARINELDLPMFHLSGWYDMYLRGSIDGYCAMAAAHQNQYLLAGPWVHLPWGNVVGGVDLGPEAAPQVDQALARWFHHWLDEEVPAEPAPHQGVRYFLLGENRWAEAAAWPPPEARQQTWFLQSDGRANSRFGDGRLAVNDPRGPEDTFNYDPEVPVTAPGGSQNGSVSWGPHDLSSQQQGLNLLVYHSDPLPARLVVAGPIKCVLHVRSSAPETHFVARLSRVTPEGRAFFLTLGAVRARAQDGAEVTLRLDSTAVVFAPGDRLCLDVASSAFPLLARSPNTGVDPAAVGGPAEFRRALQIVYHDEARPSRVILPVLPA